MRRKHSHSTIRTILLALVVAVATVVTAAAPADARPAAPPRDTAGVVDSVKGSGLFPSVEPNIRALAETDFRIRRFRWPLPSFIARYLPNIYLGGLSFSDPGTGQHVESIDLFFRSVKPWGHNGARGRNRVAVSGPPGSAAPTVRCVLDWYVDDLSGPADPTEPADSIDDAVDVAGTDVAADVVAFEMSGASSRCDYAHKARLVDGDLVVTFSGRPRLAGGLRFDMDVYVNELEHVLCVTAPCPPLEHPDTARYAFTVKNVSAVKSVSRFTSGCQHDVTITNADGDVVLAASDGRACTDQLTTLVLAPGESHTYEGELELVGRDGHLLPAGRYRAHAELIQVAGPGAEAHDSFAVRLIETGVGGPTPVPDEPVATASLQVAES